MAGIASRWEGRLHVIRIRCPVVILHVAGAAGAAGQLVIVVGMALDALQGCVRPRQRKSNRVVAEVCRRPSTCAVACLAGLREGERHVVGIRGLLIIGQVASHAIGGRTFELVVDVAGVALQGRVHARKRKACVLQVIKVDPEPGIKIVTLATGSRKPSGSVARPGRSLIILRVAGIALR